MAVFKDERKKTFLNPEGADKPLESRAAVTASEADTPRSLEAKAFAGLRGRGGLVTQADVLRARAQLQSTQASRERLKASVADAWQALTVLLAATPEQTAVVVGDSTLPKPRGLDY